MATNERPATDEPGRQVRLVPLAPGFWTLLLGAGAMVLGPLFGFLVGTMLGTDRKVGGMAPIFLFLFVGFLVAGVGLGAVLIGVRRLLLDRQAAARSAAQTGQPEQA